MAKIEFKFDRESILYYKAMDEVRELPQCACLLYTSDAADE